MVESDTRYLYIMRHAKSDWDAGISDFDRPLAPRGIKDAGAMGRWLADSVAHPLTLVHSPAARASQTMSIVNEEIGAEQVVADERLYLAELGALLAVLDGFSGNVMLIGHNPGLEELVNYLDPGIESKLQRKKLFPTAAVYAFALQGSDRIKGGGARFEFHQRPKELPRDRDRAAARR